MFGLPNLLNRHDKMFMSMGIEGRPVFADKKFFELRMRLSENFIQKNNIGKFIFKKILENYFDNKFVYRDKIGFSSPYGDWLYKKSYWGKYWDLIDYNILEEYFDVDKIKSFISLKINEKWTGNNLNF